METVKSVIPLIGQSWMMATVDLRDAYYHVPIHPEHRKFLRFAVSKGHQIKHFQFNVLPFGISSAPRVFTKIMAEAIIFIRQQGICIVPYLDDLLIMAPSASRLETDVSKSLEILQTLGWIPNLEKSEVHPSTRRKFLGVLLDSDVRTSFLPKDHQINLVRKVTKFRGQRAPTLRESMSVLGSLTACIQSVSWAQAHTRTLQTYVLLHSRRRQTPLNQKILLPGHVKSALKWWLDYQNLQRGVSWDHLPLKTLRSDASKRGWGAVVEGFHFQGQWTSNISSSSSNLRELKAVEEALKASSALIKNHHVRIYSDNMTTVAYLRHQGGTKYASLKEVAARIFFWAEKNLLSVTAVHLRGLDNTQADFLRIELGGMATEATILKAKGLSDEVIQTLQKSRKAVTNANYTKGGEDNLRSGCRGRFLETELTGTMTSLERLLTLSNYRIKMSTLLWLEDINNEIEIKDLSLSGVCLQKRGGFLVLEVPGIIEGRPSLFPGDRVLLKKHMYSTPVVEFVGLVAEIHDEEVALRVNANLEQSYNYEPMEVEFTINRQCAHLLYYKLQ
ncbi:unnamed protein product [Ranitomeya imitator]|uniref:ribonuclease H n=1 Tax=Ranitomeya imitator TaxID=111125 RepID=A0ABN9KP42_9NEOB|nr:unnamed protein product [Ranitomeya imitator]